MEHKIWVWTPRNVQGNILHVIPFSSLAQLGTKGFSRRAGRPQQPLPPTLTPITFATEDLHSIHQYWSYLESMLLHLHLENELPLHLPGNATSTPPPCLNAAMCMTQTLALLSLAVHLHYRHWWYCHSEHIHAPNHETVSFHAKPHSVPTLYRRYGHAHDLDTSTIATELCPHSGQ